MVKDRYFVLTGGFGSGKSTLLTVCDGVDFRGSLNRHDRYSRNSEPFRETESPEKDPRLFVELMLDRMLIAYGQTDTSSGLVLFDRGIPDLLAYAKLFGFTLPAAENGRQSLSL